MLAGPRPVLAAIFRQVIWWQTQSLPDGSHSIRQLLTVTGRPKLSVASCRDRTSTSTVMPDGSCVSSVRVTVTDLTPHWSALVLAPFTRAVRLEKSVPSTVPRVASGSSRADIFTQSRRGTDCTSSPFSRFTFCRSVSKANPRAKISTARPIRPRPTLRGPACCFWLPDQNRTPPTPAKVTSRYQGMAKSRLAMARLTSGRAGVR